MEIKEINPEDIKEIPQELNTILKLNVVFQTMDLLAREPSLKEINPEGVKEINPEKTKEVPPEKNKILKLNAVFQMMDLLARMGATLRAKTKRPSPSLNILLSQQRRHLLRQWL